MLRSLAAVSLGLLAVNAQRVQVSEGVIATGTMGETNPPAPTAPTEVDQNSMVRLASVNAWDVRPHLSSHPPQSH